MEWAVIDSVLNKPCLLCGEINRLHEVFWNPVLEMYVRQFWSVYVEGSFVPSHDHYAIIDNLQLLEYKYDSAN